MASQSKSPGQTNLDGLPAGQLVYARVLDIGMKAAIAILMITFALYALNLRAPHVSLAKLSENWHMSAKDFTQTHCVATGPQWVGELKYGDYMNLLGVVFLSGVSVVAYLRVLPIFIAARDGVYVTICCVEIVLLVLSMLGFFKNSH